MTVCYKALLSKPAGEEKAISNIRCIGFLSEMTWKTTHGIRSGMMHSKIRSDPSNPATTHLSTPTHTPPVRLPGSPGWPKQHGYNYNPICPQTQYSQAIPLSSRDCTDINGPSLLAST